MIEYCFCYCYLFQWKQEIVLKMADKFEALEQQLELFIENTRQIGIVVSDFQPQGQNVLNQKLWVNFIPMQFPVYLYSAGEYHG